MRIAAVMSIAAALMSTAVAGTEPGSHEIAEPPRSQSAQTAAPAGSAEDLFREFGLFGTFAADCGRPAAPANPFVTVSAPGGGVVLESNDLGSGYATNRYSVLSGRRLSAERLEVTVLFRPGAEGEERQTLIFEVRNNTRRTIFNKVEDGDVRVRNGVVLSRGVKTPLLKRCG
jgi:hypothetical protein